MVQKWTVLVQILIDYQLVTEVFGTKVDTFGKNLVRFQGHFCRVIAFAKNTKALDKAKQ